MQITLNKLSQKRISRQGISQHPHLYTPLLLPSLLPSLSLSLSLARAGSAFLLVFVLMISASALAVEFGESSLCGLRFGFQASFSIDVKHAKGNIYNNPRKSSRDSPDNNDCSWEYLLLRLLLRRDFYEVLEVYLLHLRRFSLLAMREVLKVYYYISIYIFLFYIYIRNICLLFHKIF